MVKLDFEGQCKPPIKIVGILPKVFCTSDPNLLILAWKGDRFWWKQAENGASIYYDLVGQWKLPLRPKGILTKAFYTCGRNWVVLAWIGHKLSRGSVRGWHTDTLTHVRTHKTDAWNDNTRKLKMDSNKNKNKQKIHSPKSAIDTHLAIRTPMPSSNNVVRSKVDIGHSGKHIKSTPSISQTYGVRVGWLITTCIASGSYEYLCKTIVFFFTLSCFVLEWTTKF